MDKLPSKWSLSTLGEVCSKPQYGWTCKASKKGILKILRTTDISKAQLDWNTVPYCSTKPHDVDKYKIEENDILVSRAGSVGISYRVSEVPTDTVFASYLIRFKPLGGIHPKYIEFYLQSDAYWRLISEYSAGIAVPNVNATKLSLLKIPIAPTEEQHRIVAKLEKPLAKVDQCETRLEKIPIILKRFRQSVLAAACSGELTKDLAKIIDVDRHLSKVELRKVVDSIQIGPFGSLLHKSDYVENGIPVINPTNIHDGKIQPSSNVTIKKSKKSELSRYVLKEGDVIVGRRGEMGRCAVIKKDQMGWLCGTGSLFIRPGVKIVADYLQILISSPTIIEYLENSSVGSTMTNLNQKILERMEIEVAEIDEQKEIVRRVEALFKVADRIESRYKKARVYVDKLTQSILAKAFRGELVPQDPNDEPASELLERIRAERGKRKAEGKPARTPKKRPGRSKR